MYFQTVSILHGFVKAMKNLIVNKSWGWAEAVVSVSLTLHKQQTVLLRGCHETLFIIWMKIEASVKGSPVQAKACWRRTQSLTSTHWTTIHYSSLVFIVSLATLSLSDQPNIGFGQTSTVWFSLNDRTFFSKTQTFFIIWMKIEASVKRSLVQAKACWRRTQSLISTHWTTIQYSSLVFIVSLTTLSLSFVIMFFETISKFKNSAVTKGIVLFWLWVLSRTSYHIRVHHMILTNDVKIWCIFKKWWSWYRQIPK